MEKVIEVKNLYKLYRVGDEVVRALDGVDFNIYKGEFCAIVGLRVNPAPFVLIDEIEAALDDVNVGKFAAYLHRMTDHTQFISITHRRGTMEQGDVLYGVTMEEEGISKLLRLDVAEMEKKFGKSLN